MSKGRATYLGKVLKAGKYFKPGQGFITLDEKTKRQYEDEYRKLRDGGYLEGGGYIDASESFSEYLDKTQSMTDEAIEGYANQKVDINAMDSGVKEGALVTAGALSGATMGSQIGGVLGPWGKVAGGVVGGLMGGVGGKFTAEDAERQNIYAQEKGRRDAQKEINKLKTRQKERQKKGYEDLVDVYPTEGTGRVDFFGARGGVMDLGKANMSGGGVMPLAGNVDKIVGKTHEQGGVKIANENGKPIAEVEGEEVVKDDNKVYSERLGYADEAEKLAKKKAKFEVKLNSTNRFERATAKRSVEKIDVELDRLFQLQEQLKAQEEAQAQAQMQQQAPMQQDSPQLAFGGYVDEGDDKKKKNRNRDDGKDFTDQDTFGIEGAGNVPSQFLGKSYQHRPFTTEGQEYFRTGKDKLYDLFHAKPRVQTIFGDGGPLSNSPKDSVNVNNFKLDLNKDDKFTFPNVEFEKLKARELYKFDIPKIGNPNRKLNLPKLYNGGPLDDEEMNGIKNGAGADLANIDWAQLSDLAKMMTGTNPKSNTNSKGVPQLDNQFGDDVKTGGVGNFLKGGENPNKNKSTSSTPSTQKSGNDSGGDKSKPNWGNIAQVGGNVLRTGANLALPLIDNLYNRNIIKQTPQIPMPELQKAATLKTDYNINPQLNEVDAGISAYNRGVTQSSIDPQNRRANQLTANLKGIREKNKLRGQKENIETTLTNQSAMNEQGIDTTNLAKIDAFNMNKMQREQGILSAKSQNVAQSVQDLQAGIRELNQMKLDDRRIMYDAMKYGDTGVAGYMLNDKEFINKIKTDKNQQTQYKELIKQSGRKDHIKQWNEQFPDNQI